MTGDVFAALGDPTRRWIVQRLSDDGPQTATQLASELPISRQAVSKHLGALADAGLVEGRRDGRELRYGLDLEPLREAAAWTAEVGARWDRRLERLQERLSRDQAG